MSILEAIPPSPCTNVDPVDAQSPDVVRMSLAAAMTLGFKQGLFYRNARLYCINLLLTYPGGCSARCAYCGLSARRPGQYGQKSFIRVTWPAYTVNDIIAAVRRRPKQVKRICISMITHQRAVQDTLTLCTRLRAAFDVPVSLLVSPTLVTPADLLDFKAAGADRIGVAVDLATPALFDRYRGAGVGGPHRWDTYWECLKNAAGIFGDGRIGPHLMVGMGETEQQMCAAIQRARDIGGRTHLFSFFPEAQSALAQHPQPPMEQYRRVQLARYLIDNGLARSDRMTYDGQGKIVDFGCPDTQLDAAIGSGEPFRTSGCEGYDGQVACNRPYANSRPGPDIRNYPFKPEEGDIRRIRRQMGKRSANMMGTCGRGALVDASDGRHSPTGDPEQSPSAEAGPSAR
jgi:lipoyl synthase